MKRTMENKQKSGICGEKGHE
jgi:serine/threonine protein kinase